MRTSGSLIRCVALAAAMVSLFAIFYLGVRPWYLSWGAEQAEVQRVLPGDEAVPTPHANVGSTRAITIHAPRTRVWPWLAQIGQDRAGFYSYELLEDLLGCEMPSSERIRPEFQHWQVGDKLWMYPPEKLSGVGHAVLVRYDPGRALVFATHQAGTLASEPYDGAWIFVLESIDDETTRLLVRGRAGGARDFWASMFDKLAFEPIHFLMERRMVEQIKGFAEGHPRARVELLLEPLVWASLLPLLLLLARWVMRGKRWHVSLALLILTCSTLGALVLLQPPLWLDLLVNASLWLLALVRPRDFTPQKGVLKPAAPTA